jgi:hypothetical protein
MRATADIKKKLDFTIEELERINTYLHDHPGSEDKHFVLENGKESTADWTFNDAITSYVSQKLTLQWVLSSRTNFTS